MAARQLCTCLMAEDKSKLFIQNRPSLVVNFQADFRQTTNQITKPVPADFDY